MGEKDKKDKKEKKRAREEGDDDAAASAEPGKKLRLVSPIANPLADKKLTKKVRNVEKKLRQIVELKELKVGGKPLEKNQLDKIEQEAAVQAELDELRAKLAQLTAAASEAGKWR